MKMIFMIVVLILLSGNVLVGQYINIYGNFEERLGICIFYIEVVFLKQEVYKLGLQ